MSARHICLSRDSNQTSVGQTCEALVLETIWLLCYLYKNYYKWDSASVNSRIYHCLIHFSNYSFDFRMRKSLQYHHVLFMKFFLDETEMCFVKNYRKIWQYNHVRILYANTLREGLCASTYKSSGVFVQPFPYPISHPPCVTGWWCWGVGVGHTGETQSDARYIGTLLYLTTVA
jgi:hypothetical protein